MSVFWAITALLVLLALAFALWPLLRKPADPFVGQAAGLRAQLHVLDLAERDGLVAADDAAARRARLKEDLLALLEQPAANAPRTRPPLVTVLAVAVLLPLLTLVLYRQFGSPNALLFASVGSAAASPATAQGAAAPSADARAPDLRAAAEALQARLADTPDDAEGWTLLARTWQELGEFGKASDAYAKVYAVKSDDAEALADYAQALGLASNPRSLLGQPRELLEKALQIDPQHQRAQWLYGYAQRQAGELPGTLATWDKLLKQMPQGSAEAASLVEQINIVRSELGQTPLPVPAVIGQDAAPAVASTAPASGTDNAPAAQGPAATQNTGAGLRVRVELAPALAAQVGADDVLYVFAKAKSGPPMPLAIQRVSAAQLPFAVTLDDSMAMTPALKLSTFPAVVVGARVSKSGNAQASSGDLQGFSAAIDQPSADEVLVTISDVVP